MKKLFNLLLIYFTISFSENLHVERENNINEVNTGYTNLSASNYNPEATLDDGSCILNPCDGVTNCINFNNIDSGIYSGEDCTGELINSITALCDYEPFLGNEEECIAYGGVYFSLPICLDIWTYLPVEIDNENECMCGVDGEWNPESEECSIGQQGYNIWLGELPIELNSPNNISLLYDTNNNPTEAIVHYEVVEDEIMPFIVEGDTIVLGDINNNYIINIIENENGTNLIWNWQETYCASSVYESIQTDIFGCTDLDNPFYNSYALINDGSCEVLIYGCFDEEAINYNNEANTDDGSCLYLENVEPHFTQLWENIPNNPMGIYVSSAMIDGENLRIGDEIALYDSDVCVGTIRLEQEIEEYVTFFVSADDPSTPEQDGFIAGNPIQFHLWDASAEIELVNLDVTLTSGTTYYQNYGSANVSLDVQSLYGCTIEEALNYDSNATINDGSCIVTIPGCMDMEACNYDSEANYDDESCEYPSECLDCDAQCLCDIDCNGVCGGISETDECGVCDGDDSSCTGCTNPYALNYDEYAIVDFGCQYPAIGDINGDNTYNVIDILQVVQIILNNVEYIFIADLNEDGFINVVDVLLLVNWILNGVEVPDCAGVEGGDNICGCDDETAQNYNSDVTFNDGTCDYTIIDIDGNVYETVLIGDQLWMAENLKVTHYNNGDEIPKITNNGDWSSLSTGGYGDYDNNPSNSDTYGRLYNWYTVDDSRGVCPVGWHVPSDDEWTVLTAYLGGESVAGGRMKLTGTLEDGDGLWYTPNTGATNESGFTALPGGFRTYAEGIYININVYANFWSSTENNMYVAYFRYLTYDSSEVGRFDLAKQNGYSVRCIRDD